MKAPTSYVVIDTETNDFSNAFVLQMGFCVVEDGKIIEQMSMNIVPPPGLHITPGAAKVHGLTYEILEKTGSAHEEILPDIREAIIEYGTGWMMGQNFTFDTQSLNSTFKHAGMEPIDFSEMQFIDVGVTFKAHRLRHEWDWGAKAQRGNRDLNAFYSHIKAQRTTGLKWNIDYCMNHFEVEAKKRGDHDAGEDCKLTHLIYEKMREQGIIEEILFNAE